MMKPIIKRILAVFLLILIAGGTVCGLLHHLVTARTKNLILSPEQLGDVDPDCILVLGAGVRDDGTPSHMLEDRLFTGIDLYESNVCDTLLMSGDHSRKDYDEVNTMKQYAMDRGVPSQDIFMDHAGFSTYDSLYRARDIFQAKKVVIVTQKYHLYRALYTAQAMGLEAYGVPADLREYGGMPYFELREKIARISYVFICLFHGKPKYLGDTIPLTGSGDVTND